MLTRSNSFCHRLLLLMIVVAGFVFTAHPDGLPGEYIVTQRWRDMIAGHSAIHNPSFLTEENYTTFHGAFSMTLGNAFKLWDLGATMPLGLYQSVGVSWLGLSADNIESNGGWIQGANGDWEPLPLVGQDSLISDAQNFFAFSYAINPWNRLSVGANVTIGHHSNFGSAKTGLGFDLGISYRLFRHPLIGDHVAGIMLQNLIPVVPLDYSRNLKLSWIGRFWERRIEAGLDVDIKDWMAQASNFTEGSQVEYDLNGRLGFWVLRVLTAYFQAGTDHWGFSGGINVPTINNGRDFHVQYQYMSMLKSDNAASHTVYVRGDVGKHREEIYARKMAHLSSIEPNDLYNKALTLFKQGKHWDAYYVFGRIIVEYPDFFKNDWVNYYMGRCHELLDMRASAEKIYNKTKSSYSKSVVVPYSDLGIMRVQYRNGNTAAVENQFSRLNTPNVPDSLKFHAYYLMAESHLNEGNYNKAIQLFDMIPSTHPEFLFAQHSLATAYAMADQSESALGALENCLQAIPKNKAEKEIVNRSYLLIGYFFFDGLGGQERSLSKAVTALRNVESGSIYYPQAVLGLAWAAMKAQQWSDCMKEAGKLKSLTDDPVLRAEASLLEGYVHMVQQKYQQAVDVLAPTSDKLANMSAPSESEKDGAMEEYESIRESYQHVASRSQELALTRQNSMVVSSIDSLKSIQESLQEDIDEQLQFFDSFEQRSFFSRNIDKVREDVDYALAKAQELSGAKSSTKDLERTKEQSEDIDDEMRKLQEQLEELEED
ncbi:MAG: tetratricopeptide repeat protein [Fibrobacterota bacterium]